MKSPCVKVCKLDAMGRYCTGCGRTLEQIASWGKINAKDK